MRIIVTIHLCEKGNKMDCVKNEISEDSITTKAIEHLAYWYLYKMGTYLCFEVGMPKKHKGTGVDERVDLLSYDSKDIWRFYEIKISKSDFYSKCKHTFLGHYNYFIMPKELYDEVKEDIPNYVGVYAVWKHKNGHLYMSSVQNPKKQELKIDKDRLMYNFMQALSREYRKYRKLLKL
jgi:hypothetical protein